MEQSGAANVGGLLITLPGRDTWWSRCIAFVSEHPVGVGNSAFRLGKGNQLVDTVPFGGFRKEIFNEVGLYREDLPRNQDYELNACIRAAGYKIFLSRRLRTKYYNSSNVVSFICQAFSNGRGVVRCLLVNRHSFCWRHVAQLLFVVTILLIDAFAVFNYYASIVARVYCLTYVIIIVYAGVEIALRNNWRYVVLVPVLIGMYHICYGSASAFEALRALIAFVVLYVQRRRLILMRGVTMSVFGNKTV